MKISDEFSRRRFLKYSALLGAEVTLVSAGLGCGGRLLASRKSSRLRLDLAIAKGDSPARNCIAAVEALGGFSKFVREGDRVVIKPNPIGNSPPEQAVNTHPEMVAAVIRECHCAGASQVIVLSHDSRRSIIANGTAAAVERSGGTLKVLENVDEFREVVVPRSRILRRERIAIDVLECDVFINMPIAKHHAGSEVTLAMKNLMGINWDRLRFHQTDLQQCIAELTGTVRHNLIIMDANHVLLTGGPGGPGEVLRAGQVIAGIDPVAVDAYTTRFFNREPETVGHIRIAHDLGMGEIDLAKLRINEYLT